MRRSQYAALLFAICFSLLLCAPAAVATPIKLRVTAELANVRERPDISSAVLKQVAEGTELEAERKEGEWFAVWVEKEEGGFLLGYVHESLVRVVEPPQKKEEDKQPAQKPVEEPPQAQKPRPTQPPPRPQPGAEEKRYSLSLWIGPAYASVGDLNEGAAGMASYFESRYGGEAQAEVGSLHWGYLLALEFQVPLSSGFCVSFGAEYFSAERSSSGELALESSTGLYLFKPKVTAIPLSLSLVYYPVDPFYLKAGLDFNWARCAYLYRYEQGDFWERWKGGASSGSLGFHLGAGLNWSVHPNVSLVAEALYRQGKVGELQGEGSFRSSRGSDSSAEGTLYFWREMTTGKGYVPYVLVRDRDPSGEPGVTDAREAVFNLSGMSLRLGIRFRF